jgi:hypothetical protein
MVASHEHICAHCGSEIEAERGGFGKKSMNPHSLGVNRNTTATMLNSSTGRN